ncbi:MAG: hypothetical protein RL220_807 [Bacteroidota bacterium]
MNRKTIDSGAPWESVVGYSRAVRHGNLIEVSGTTSVVDGTVVSAGDMAGQTRVILEKIEAALHQLGATRHHVIRTRMFVTDIARWEEAGRVHGEFFAGIRPATTMVEVKSLIHPDMLIEIEATAWVD